MQERKPYCVFCNIVAKQEPATVRYEDDEFIVFDNLLRWAPVMLLVVQKRHYTQEEFWSSELVVKAGRIAVQMGKQHCPQGFRVLANFGGHGLQSQDHGHMHVLGGTYLGRYV